MWHEFRTGLFMAGRKERDYRDIPRKQWVILFPLMILAWIIFTTYAALHGHYNMENAWFYMLGLPWMMFPFGGGAIKKEWRNKTEGWWLSLPYSRFQLIGAKFVAAWLKVLIVLVGTYLLAFLYALYMAFIVGHFHFHFQPVTVFMLKGTAWYSLLFSLSPVFVSLGTLRGVIRYTSLRSTYVVLMGIIILASFLFYYVIGTFNGKGNLYVQFSGFGTPDLSPFFHVALVLILIGILFTYFILRWSAFLLERKLDL
jgi:ABC-2 type transport system permease protein